MSAIKDICLSLLHIAAFFFAGMGVYIMTLLFYDSTRLYYDGLLAVLVMLFISYATVAAFFAKKKGNESSASRQSLYTAAFAGAILVYAFHITLPTIIDRSISLFVLSRMEGSAEGVRVEELQKAFLEGYVQSNNAVCRRLDEQLTSGNISFRDGKYYIAPAGHFILQSLRFIATMISRTQYYINEAPFEKQVYTYDVQGGRCVPRHEDSPLDSRR